MNKERISRIIEKLKLEGFDAVVLKLPENVLFTTGYWPLSGLSFVLLTRNGDCTLIVSEPEMESAKHEWAGDIRGFGLGQIKDTANPYDVIGEHLKLLKNAFGLKGATIGIEDGFETIAPYHMAGESFAFSGVTKSLIKKVFDDCIIKDATQIINELRAKKTKTEIEKLRRANDIARYGAEMMKETLQPGLSEVEVAANIEQAIQTKGVGYKGVRSARGWAIVNAGINSANSYKPFMISTTKKLVAGDFVLLELGVCADGFWADITRTMVIGKTNDRQKEIVEIVNQAQKNAINTVRPGVIEHDVDDAARSYINKAGYGKYFYHNLGHGIGFRYHEPIPVLCPSANGRLEEGMVFSVEPGVYIEGFGGYRIEHDVVVTKNGADIL